MSLDKASMFLSPLFLMLDINGVFGRTWSSGEDLGIDFGVSGST